MKKPVDRPTLKQMAAEKEAIIQLMSDGMKHSFTEIQNATGIETQKLWRRLESMRGRIEKIERDRNGTGSYSYWQLAIKPGEVPAKMLSFPVIYLRFGGWMV